MKLLIIDLETTGKGIDSRIVEIAIVELDTVNYKYKILLNIVFHQELSSNNFLFENNIFTKKEIEESLPELSAKCLITDLLSKYHWTSYNNNFEYNILINSGYNINIPDSDIMKDMTPIARIDSNFKWDWKYPKLTEAYKYLFHGEKVYQNHRALDDTILATKVKIKLLQLKNYQEIFKNLIKNESEVNLEYRSLKLKNSKRNFLPKALSRSDTIVKGFDYLHREERSFNLTRIIKLNFICYYDDTHILNECEILNQGFSNHCCFHSDIDPSKYCSFCLHEYGAELYDSIKK